MVQANVPRLLNDDGSASMATLMMMSHHGLRRDIAQFAIALRRVMNGDSSKLAALQTEWQSYHTTLHGHHQMEDAGIFPGIQSQQASLASVVEQLMSDHKRIDPLLERGDQAFAELPRDASAAAATVSELSALLEKHLAIEETHIVPLLRGFKEFPPPTTDAEVQLYAQGFAWSSHGIAQEVLERVYAMLPELLTTKLPEARAMFEQRCERVWGTAKAGASQTPIPEWLTASISL